MNTVIQPWIQVSDGFEALLFYREAFGAQETYRLEPGEGQLVARLSIAGSSFWISSGGEKQEGSYETVRFIVVVQNPEYYCKKAIDAGAKEVFGVREEYGWMTGKIQDPFGFQWEFGYEI